MKQKLLSPLLKSELPLKQLNLQSNQENHLISSYPRIGKSILVATAILFLIGMGTACEPKEKPTPHLVFDIPVIVMPEREIYNVGDTIWIDINFNKVLTDTSGMFSVAFEDYNFNATLNILKLMNKNQHYVYQPGGFNSVKIENVKGEIDIVGDALAVMIYEFDMKRYSFKSSIIIKHPGVYSMLFSTANSVYNSDFITSWKVNDQIINIGELFYQVNKGGNRNTHLIFENTSNNWDESVWPNNVHLPFYTFKVEQ